MDAAVSPHTTVNVTHKTQSLAFGRVIAARIELPRLNVAKYWRGNVSCVRQRCVFKAQSPRQYENWRGMASVWGPGTWVKWRFGWRREAWPRGGVGVIASANHTVSFRSKLRLPRSCSANIHVPGVLAPRNVSCTVAWWSNRRNCWKFSERRLVYKLVFTQYALFPQPSLREGLAGYAAQWGKWETPFTIWMHLTPAGSKCLCYH